MYPNISAMAVCSRISRKLRTLQVQTQDFHTDWPMEQDLQPAAVPTERVTSCSTKKQHWEFVFNVPNTKELHLSRQNHQQAFPDAFCLAQDNGKTLCKRF